MDYAGIKAQIASYAHRTDLTTEIVDFITKAERTIASLVFLSEQRDRQTSLTLTGGTRTVALPARTEEVRGVYISGTELEYISPDVFYTYVDSGSGTPSKYTIYAGALEFNRAPASDTTVVMDRIKAIDLATDDSNAISTAAPLIYVYGGLARLYEWAQDEQRADRYEVKMIAEIGRFNALQRRLERRHSATARIDSAVMGASRTRYNINLG